MPDIESNPPDLDRESKQVQRRVIVEVGVGTEPFCIKYGILLPPNTIYTGLDIIDKNFSELKSKSLELGYGDNVKFQVMQKSRLDLIDESVDECVMSNVLSWEFADEGPFRDKEDYEEKRELFLQAARVIKPGGRIMLYENIPVFSKHSFVKIIEDFSQDPNYIVSRDTAEEARINKMFGHDQDPWQAAMQGRTVVQINFPMLVYHITKKNRPKSRAVFRVLLHHCTSTLMQTVF